jgi:hypothetical protein
MASPRCLAEPITQRAAIVTRAAVSSITAER